MTSLKQILSATALVAVTSVVAAAQSDFGSPIGAGAGLGGAVAPFGVPGAAGRAGAALSGPAAAGLARARAAFANAGANGVSVTNPAGGNVNLPQAAAQALGAALGGSVTPAQAAALANAGVPAGLTTALAALGSNPSMGSLSRAIAAFNAAIDAAPAGTPAPALLAARQALFAASAR